MNVTTTTAPARTDVTPAADAAAPAVTEKAVRGHALVLAAGTASWAAASFTYGFTPDSDTGTMIQDLTGFAFQFGVLSLVGLQLKTRATGLGRKAVGMLKVEGLLLGLAMTWSFIHGVVPSARDEVWLAVLDVFWPLSMLGMAVIGIKVALTGRWRGAARFWPLVAESWVLVSLPSLAIFGREVGEFVGATHLLVGYMTLGLIIAARPHLVLPAK